MGNRPDPVIWEPPRWFTRGLILLTCYLVALGGAVTYGFLHQDDQITEACEASRRADKAIARDILEVIGEETGADAERVERAVKATIRRADARYGC